MTGLFYGGYMAVREGFEPSIRCRIHTFQACSFDHSDTSPITFMPDHALNGQFSSTQACPFLILNYQQAYCSKRLPGCIWFPDSEISLGHLTYNFHA